MPKNYQAPSVKKAFQILHLIARNPEGLGISDLSRLLNLSKGTVHGVISALESFGAVVRDPGSKKYHLGITLLELGRQFYEQIELRHLARPHMEQLMEATGATVFIGVLNINRITILDVVESNNDLKITSPVGTTISIFAGAAGKVMLASLPEEEARRIVMERELPAFTPNSITDPSLYLQEIDRVKKQGFATDYEEYLTGVWAAAAPIKGWRQFRSAIWAVGFKTALNNRGMENLINKTVETASKLSQTVQQKL